MTSLKTTSASPSSRRRIVTFFVVALLHAGLILGPVWMFDLFERRKPKENMFRVKIGATELSQGPVTGMPERTPPRPPAPPAPPEPKIPAPPPKPIPAEPRIPRVLPKPKPKPKPKAKPKPKPKVKPRPKKKPQRVKPRPEPRVPVRKKTVKKPRKPTRKPIPQKPRRNPDDDVYQDPNPPNLNPKVPVGRRSQAQKYAPRANNKAPGGGRKADEAAWIRYGKNVERYVYSRWTEPPRSLLGGEFPETVIQVTIEANGRVSSARILRSSGNRPMEASVQALLANLDLLPRPPEGRTTFNITLKTR